MQIDDLRVERVPIDQLKPWDKNPRKGHAVDAIEKSIESFGYLDPIVVQARTLRVLAGHGRLKALVKAGAKEVPVVIADLDDDAATQYTIADNKLTERSSWDQDVLEDLMRDLNSRSVQMELTGFEDAEIQRLLSDPKPEDDVVPESRPDIHSQVGDLWELGQHRLMCGDATHLSEVQKLFDGAKPFIMVTDPPYGVEYDPAWRNKALGQAKRRLGTVQHDERVDWADAFKLFTGCVAYVWHGDKYGAEVAMALQRADFEIRSQIVWAKPQLVPGRGHYHWQHETCWYAVRTDIDSAKWKGGRKQSTVWTIQHLLKRKGDGADSTTDHGTQKPVECMERPIRNHGEAHDHVYDPFVGSGTTIIAAEKLGRRCYAMEIDPRYVDISVRRWQDFTGKQARNITRPEVQVE